MELLDITRNIAQYLDNLTLQKVYLAGGMPHLLLLSQDELFWHARVETLIGRRVAENQMEDDTWRDTYYILSQELEKKRSSKLPPWNERDNILGMRILLKYYQKECPNLRSDITSVYGNASPKILRFILDELNTSPKDMKWDPLMAAIAQGRIDAVRYLLSHKKIDPLVTRHHSRYDQISTISEACLSGLENDYEIVRMLLEKNVLPIDNDLILAVRGRGNIDLVKLLLSCPTVNITGDALSIAAMNGKTDILKILISDPRISIGGEELLLLACNRRQTEVVRLLLSDRRIIPTRKSLEALLSDNRLLDGKSSRIGVMDLLLREKRISPEDRRKAILEWNGIDRVEMCAFFIENRSLLNRLRISEKILQLDGYEEFISAIQGDNHERVELLLEDERYNNRFFLHKMFLLSVMRGYFRIVRLLLGNYRYANHAIKGALDLASEKGYQKICILLKRHVDPLKN